MSDLIRCSLESIEDVVGRHIAALQAGVDVLGIGLDNLPPTLVTETIKALPRHDFKNAFLATLVERLAHAPQSATMTWLSEIANEHVPNCRCPSFACLLKNSPFNE